MAKNTAKTETVTLLGPVDHDGTRYEEGAQLDVSAEQAAALRAAGAVAPLPQADEEQPQG